MFVEAEAAYAELDVDLRLGDRRHRAVDTRERTRDARRRQRGALRPARARLAARCRAPLGIPGEELAGVHTYRTLDDAQAVRAAAESATSALVIGGGFIGMETTASLRRRGLAVTQIDLGDALYASLQRAGAVALARAALPRARRRGHPRRRRRRVPRQRRQADGRRHARRPRDRRRARDRRRRRAALDRLPRRLGRAISSAARCSSTSASRRTSRASAPSATSRTSTTRSSATVA